MATHHNLADESVEMVLDLIKSDIATALVDIRADRSDPRTRTTVPVTYFNHEPPAWAFKSPAIWVVCDNIDFGLEKGQNHINASVFINVGIVIEDRLLKDLTRRCYRYQAALHKILAQRCLNSTDEEVRITILVRNATFSPVFTDAQEKGNARGVFRKECVLELEVRQFEEL
jgi:hypothetical protein